MKFAEELRKELLDDILPYWTEKMTDPAGGFYGRRDGYDRLEADAEKGAILNARLLWTLSAIARTEGSRKAAEGAQRAFRYVTEHFIDREYGGAFWSLNADGTPRDTKKQFYAIAFVIYGLVEYYRLTNYKEALDTARELFRVIEKHSRDRELGGYTEAMARDWTELADVRLSDKDDNAPKTMNTHLHILEAYTQLYRVEKTEEVREALVSLIRIFLDRIINPATGHMGLFFDMDWKRVSENISYGHDIEASWLLLEAAEEAGDPELTAEVLKACELMADAAMEGLSEDGSMAYELHLPENRLDDEKHWWVQAETVVGLIWLAKHHGRKDALPKAEKTWNYIKENLLDREQGEWYWSRMPDGRINRRDDKAGFWKCPYHNARMCMEGIKELG